MLKSMLPREPRKLEMNYNKIGMWAGGLATLVGGAAVGYHLPEMNRAEVIQDTARMSECYFKGLAGMLGAYLGAGIGFFSFLNERYEFSKKKEEY